MKRFICFIIFFYEGSGNPTVNPSSSKEKTSDSSSERKGQPAGKSEGMSRQNSSRPEGASRQNSTQYEAYNRQPKEGGELKQHVVTLGSTEDNDKSSNEAAEKSKLLCRCKPMSGHRAIY